MTLVIEGGVRLLVFIATLAAASSAAAQAPAVIDAGHARDLGLAAEPLTVPVAPGTPAERAVSQFLAQAERQGASYVSRLSWAWMETDPWGVLLCSAPLAVMVSQPWRIRLGRESCVPADASARMRTGIRGEIYRSRSRRAMSRAQMRKLAEQLEPPPPRRAARSRRSRRSQRRRWRAQRRDMRSLAEQLE